MNQYKSNKHMYTIDRKNLNPLLKFLFSISFFFFLSLRFAFPFCLEILYRLRCVSSFEDSEYTFWYTFDVPFVWIEARLWTLTRSIWRSRKLNVIHRGITNISFLGCPLNLKRCTSKLNVDSSVQQWLHYQNCIITS